MSIYNDEALIRAVQQSLSETWGKLKDSEATAISAALGTTGCPAVADVLKWGPFNDYEEQTVMRKALQSKVKSWFTREAKKANKTDKQSAFAAQIDSKAQTAKKRIPKIHVLYAKDSIYSNTDWKKGINTTALAMVRVGLASFSTFSTCFLYYDVGSNGQPKTNYVAKLVNDKSGTKVVKFVSI